MVEVQPFSKITFKSTQIEREWGPIQRRIYDCVSFTEYEMVKRGLRRCDVYDFSPHNMMPRLKKVGADGLTFLPMLISKTYGGYGHRHYPTSTFEKDTFVYGVVAKKVEDAIMFHDAGVIDVRQRINPGQPTTINPNGIDHALTGSLLGYPPCDTAFFERTWLKDGCLDPMYEMALNTEGVEETAPGYVKVSGNPMLNRLCRYWGFNIVPHFPHSFDCEPSARFAETWFSLMKERDPEAAEACLELLSMPMKWSLKNAVTVVDHPLFYGSANGYYRVGKVTVEWFPK